MSGNVGRVLRARTYPLKFWVMILTRREPNTIRLRCHTSAWDEWTLAASIGGLRWTVGYSEDHMGCYVIEQSHL